MDFNGPRLSLNLGRELINLNETISQQEIMIDELTLKAAMYKMRFFGKANLADRLNDQIMENFNSLIGEWNGFCFASWRANAVYRNLRDMLRDGLITQDEYEVCVRL